MSLDTDRILGRLEEHKEQANRRLDTIELKIDDLQAFKWRWAGGFAAILFVMNAAAWLVGVLFASGK